MAERKRNNNDGVAFVQLLKIDCLATLMQMSLVSGLFFKGTSISSDWDPTPRMDPHGPLLGATKDSGEFRCRRSGHVSEIERWIQGLITQTH